MASVLTLADAQAHLNITVSTYDSELQTFIDAAEAALTNKVGPLQASAQTDRVLPANGRLRTRVAPVVSLTSVTSAEGLVLTLTDLHLDQRAGVVTPNIVGVGFISPYYDVVYSAGRTVSATVNGDLYAAIKELLRHLWESQRGAGVRPGTVLDVPPGAGFLLPYRVQELISPHLQAGFA